MARPKQFDRDQALDAAIAVFREHGFAGSSAAMLTDAMRIGRQSLYDTFGDKWRLYATAVQRYARAETQAHLDALRSGETPYDGLRLMLERVASEAHTACLGVNSICEFGKANTELTEIREAAGRVLHAGFVAALRAAQADGDIAADVSPEEASAFLNASIAGIRIAARDGADEAQLRSLARITLRAFA
ncbi:TetR/AcrR family transcriptional regulator [Novosphingobium sp. PS1R-30]|uniref:TetR/AcrR family transcriptional regulator n=1 Tax=Novosphingobium anseongense TaxID=3133436 RepID=A0ABU8RTL0_9SPHN